MSSAAHSIITAPRAAAAAAPQHVRVIFYSDRAYKTVAPSLASAESFAKAMAIATTTTTTTACALDVTDVVSFGLQVHHPASDAASSDDANTDLFVYKYGPLLFGVLGCLMCVLICLVAHFRIRKAGASLRFTAPDMRI